MKALLTAIVLMLFGPATFAATLECGISNGGGLPQEISKTVSTNPGSKATYELATFQAGTPNETIVFVDVLGYGSANPVVASSTVYAVVNGLRIDGRGALLLSTPDTSNPHRPSLDVHCRIENDGQTSPGPKMSPGPTVE
jgi:hypothetical protein